MLFAPREKKGFNLGASIGPSVPGGTSEPIRSPSAEKNPFSPLAQKLLFFGEARKNKEKRSNSIRKQTCFSWRTNGIQSFIG
jgi:hypothetical protein